MGPGGAKAQRPEFRRQPGRLGQPQRLGFQPGQIGTDDARVKHDALGFAGCARARQPGRIAPASGFARVLFMTTGSAPALPNDLPFFTVDIPPPDLSAHLQGNTGVQGFTCRDSGRPGPHVVLVSLIHGNEFAGAIVLKELLESGFTPLCGKVTLGFANLAAYARFDAANPIASRYVEEDMNRVWDDFALFGVRRSAELDRAREIKPILSLIHISEPTRPY